MTHIKKSRRFVGFVLMAALVFSCAAGAQTPTDAPKTNEPAAKPDSSAAQPSEPTSPAESPATPPASPTLPNDRPVSDAWKKFSELPLWDDDLSEMSYYEATCTLNDKPRKYIRVHLLNRESIDPIFQIKATDKTADATPVFKSIISEEIPTENYNYRFLITTFLERPSLRPAKVSLTCQEWGGSTFKYLSWERRKEFDPNDWSLDICCYSYFPEEGDRWFPHVGRSYIDPYESLFIFARAIVASGGEQRVMSLLKSLHSNHMVDPNPIDAVIKPDGKPHKITVPLGEFEAQRVVVEWSGPTTWFEVETAAPYRLLAFKADDVEAQLKFVERRAYWNQDKPSGFHKPNEAP